MQRRIFIGMALLVALSIVFASLVLGAVFYGRYSRQTRSELRMILHMLTDGGEYLDGMGLPGAEVRITLVAPDGEVLYDSVAEPEQLAGHLGREEIDEALSLGEGESSRYSETLGARAYYCAVRLGDGTVLRLARTESSMWGAFAEALYAVGGAVLLAVAMGTALAALLARRVVKPLRELDLTGGAAGYDELTPLVRTLAEHRRTLEERGDELSRSAGTISAVMDNMNEGVLLLDGRTHILSLNRSAVEILDAPANMEGRSVLELLRDVELTDAIKRALAGQRGELGYARGERLYRVVVNPAASTGAILLFWDITESDRAERMRREFSANVSHELKTPLTTIYGNAEMLAGGLVKQGDQHAFHNKIKDETARLIGLIDDIILLSELDEGARRDTFEPLELSELAREAVAALAEAADGQGIELRVEGDVHIKGNRSMLYELFYNLISNGIKYTPKGGSVAVELWQGGSGPQHAKIVVTDTGVGIPQGEQERIFERFYRVDRSRSKKSGGSGLGLAIVKHIAMTHGGSIEVSSEPGGGASFTVLL